MSSVFIRYLHFLMNSHGGPDVFRAFLRNASQRFPDFSNPESEKAFFKLDAALEKRPSCRILLHRRLLLEGLMQKDPWIMGLCKQICPASFPFHLKDRVEGLCFPVFFQNSAPRWWLILADEELADMVIYDADDSFRESILRAAEWAGVSAGVHILPVDTPEGAATQQGASAGLAFFLAFCSLKRQKDYPVGLGATGWLGENGDILPVAGLREKRDWAENVRMRFFLLPEACCEPHWASSDPVCLGVNNISDALLCMEAFEDGMDFSGILWSKDARACLDDFIKIPFFKLRRMVQEERFQKHLEDYIKEDGAWKKIFILIHESIVKGELEKALLLKDSCLPLLSRMPDQTNLHFLWAFACFFLELRRGHPERAASMAEKMLCHQQAVEWDDTCRNIWRIGISLDLIHKFHDRYRFDEPLPDWVMPLVEKSCHKLSIRKQRAGLAADTGLGALCGTLSQHFGFQQNYEVSVYWAEKSIWAFGGRENTEMRESWIRAFHYLFYAACDAGDEAAAEDAFLMVAGGISPEKFMLKKRHTPWERALFARFGAEAGTSSLKEYLVKNLWPEALGKKGHPWQLIWHNVGRMARSLGDEKAALIAQKESLRCCLDRMGGPTIRMMALLPLSEMASMGRLDPQRATNCLAMVQSSIPEKDWGITIPDNADLDWLHGFNAMRKKWFPFSYR
ncbi:Lon protease-like protein [Desulfobotulus alkaliphilus]|uniref:Lon protease-like protein n=1 Tax=Desulfobotulus alkaliphilus TaxID=622671 RepID=A0A562RZ39_9BACT|nr:S16 family serine protease [Desulfobotulus alkaliphilus]TWI74419.1 Lon protease-like protein [Desulfobotulus alkaliphilus]